MKSAFLFSLNLSSQVLSSQRLSDMFPSPKLLTPAVLGQKEKANFSQGPKDRCGIGAAIFWLRTYVCEMQQGFLWVLKSRKII